MKSTTAWFRYAIAKNATFKKGTAFTLSAYPNEPDIYKVTVNVCIEKGSLLSFVYKFGRVARQCC